jgi:hypothetical protein
LDVIAPLNAVTLKPLRDSWNPRHLISYRGRLMTAKLYAGVGSRETPPDILARMTAIAVKASIKDWTLRSGAADGADSAFEAGAKDKEIWLPWRGYNKHFSQLIVRPGAIAIASKFHPAWDRCSQGAQKLHGRNMHILLGEDLNTPVEFVVCWTKDGLASGGTGQAIRAAKHYKIPVYNLFSEVIAL